MAVTRIKSNQITDGAVTNAKIADASIQGGKLANSFTYGSDFTVSGNLTVNGTTTTVDTVTTTIDDPILLLGSNQTGAASVDLGILGERGDDTNVFVGYDESADEFVTALTSTSDSNSAVTITDYADMHVGGLTADDAITATGNVTGGNLVTAGDVTTATVTTSGEATLASATVSDLTSGRVVYTGASGSLQDSANLTYNGISLGTSNLFITCNSVTSSGDGTYTGNVSGGNLTTAGDVTTATVTASGNVAGGNLTTAGTVTGGTLTDGTASISSGAVSGVTTLATSGEATLASATVSDLTSGRVVYAGGSGALQDSANLTYNGITLGTSNLFVTCNSVTASGTGAFTGNVTGGNLTTAGDVTTATVTASGNVSGGNLTTAGDVTTATVTTSGEATLASATVSDLTSGRVVYTGASGSLQDSANLTYNGISLGTSNLFITCNTVTSSGDGTFTGNVSGGNLTTAGDVTTATVTASGAISGASANLSSELVSMLNTTLYGNLTVGASADIEMNQNVIGNVGTPTATTDAATKGYVDNLLSSGFTIADSANNQQTIAQGDTMTLNGTANEVEVTVGATDTVTIGLPDDVEVTGDLTVGGNLTVQGSQTIVDATSTSIVDPILQLGRGANNAALTSNDGNDRGVAMYYYSGSEKVAFFGWDDPSNEFRFIPEATISSEEVTGSLGTANLGKVRVDSIDIDSNSITTTSGNLELTAAAGSHVKVPTGDTLVVEDIANTHILYSNAGELEGGSGLTYNGTELYADNGNIGGYLTVTGAVTATGNVTGGNLITSAAVESATVTTTGEATLASATVSDLTSGRVVYAGASGALQDSANLTYNGISLGTSNLFITCNTVTSSGDGTFTGNVSGGNLTTAGDVTTATVTASGNVNGGNVVATADVTTATVTATGNITGGNLSVGNGKIDGGNIQSSDDFGASRGSIFTTFYVGQTATVGNLSTGGTVTATGNVTGGNLTTAGEATLASATVSDLTSGRVVYAGTDGALQDSANLTYNGITLGTSNMFVTCNTVTSSGDGSFTGNVSGGNLTTAGDVTTATVTATGTVTGGTLTDGTMSVNAGAVTGVASLAVDNITIDGTDITTSASELTINDAGADVNFRVEGDTNTELFFVDAGLNKIGLGGAPSAGNCTVCIETTDALKLPVGTTAQRPTGAAGMIRYNSSTDQVEGWDVSEGTFKALGVPAFTTIASETFSGDGSTTGFTLGSDQTTQSCIISINGVVQLPTTAYAVSGNALTFTEAPESGDTIEVRQITTTTTVASLSNGDQSVTIECGDSQVDITGDVVVTGNLTFSGQNFLGQYNHSNVYVASSSDETNNTGSTLAITAGTLGFDLTQASYYQVFMNRQLLRPDEITVNLTNGTITFASDTLAANDEIEAVFLAT